jgi:hypothetical protein
MPQETPDSPTAAGVDLGTLGADVSQMPAALKLVIGLIAAGAGVAYLFDFRGVATYQWKAQLEMREQLAARFRWAPRPPPVEQLRLPMVLHRLLATIIFLSLGAALLIGGVHSL